MKIYKTIYDSDGKLHSETEPSFVSDLGDSWYYHGKLHRTDGPAVNLLNDKKIWHFYGKSIKCKTQEEFERIIKLAILW